MRSKLQNIVGVIGALLFGGGYVNGAKPKSAETVDIPEIVRRIPTIPREMKEEEVFAFLGIRKTAPVEREVEGRTGHTVHRYRVGRGNLYILHCEFSSKTIRKDGLNIPVSGKLTYVALLKRDSRSTEKSKTVVEWKWKP